MAIYSQLKTRYQNLIGEGGTDPSTESESHINYAIKDICNAFPFSWNITSADLTLSSGVANLPTDYNQKWKIFDARVENSNNYNDNVFTQINISDRDKYAEGDYVYWITYNTTTGRYVFNSKTQTGTVKVYYYFIPTDLSGANDVCVVPDIEAVAYLAASKNWIADERNTGLKNVYEQEASSRIQALYSQDLNFSEIDFENSKISDNRYITDRGV